MKVMHQVTGMFAPLADSNQAATRVNEAARTREASPSPTIDAGKVDGDGTSKIPFGERMDEGRSVRP
jgi:hypothetical protein